MAIPACYRPARGMSSVPGIRRTKGWRPEGPRFDPFEGGHGMLTFFAIILADVVGKLSANHNRTRLG